MQADPVRLLQSVAQRHVTGEAETMGQPGGIILAYLVVMVAAALLAAISQSVAASIFRGTRWLIKLESWPSSRV